MCDVGRLGMSGGGAPEGREDVTLLHDWDSRSFTEWHHQVFPVPRLTLFRRQRHCEAPSLKRQRAPRHDGHPVRNAAVVYRNLGDAYGHQRWASGRHRLPPK
jgi:hypothetical protein